MRLSVGKVIYFFFVCLKLGGVWFLGIDEVIYVIKGWSFNLVLDCVEV